MQKKLSLIEFSIENWGPFKEKSTFSMSTRKKDGHTFESNGENLLKTTLIYGPNASGKSSILDAFRSLRRAVVLSANTEESTSETSKLPHTPFLGSEESNSKPTFFEAIFSLENTDFNGVYRYAFSVLLNKVVMEELSEIKDSGKESKLIERHKQNIITDDKFGSILNFLTEQGDIREDALLLSVFAQLNNKFASEIVDAFRKANVITGVEDAGYKQYTSDKFHKNIEFKNKVLMYLQKADFCINDGEVRDDIVDEDTGKIKKIVNIFFSHPVFSNDSKEVGTFAMPIEKESDGTNSFFHMLGPIIDTIENGKVLFIDELDNSLHPLLTKFIVELFESPAINTNNAQLIATTHDISLLSNKELIKDQFWFTEKDKFGSSKLFSLAEFAGTELRNDAEYSKKYLEGRFGALPVLGMVSS